MRPIYSVRVSGERSPEVIPNRAENLSSASDMQRQLEVFRGAAQAVYCPVSLGVPRRIGALVFPAPASLARQFLRTSAGSNYRGIGAASRSEEHTSELQSRGL